MKRSSAEQLSADQGGHAPGGIDGVGHRAAVILCEWLQDAYDELAPDLLFEDEYDEYVVEGMCECVRLVGLVVCAGYAEERHVGMIEEALCHDNLEIAGEALRAMESLPTSVISHNFDNILYLAEEAEPCGEQALSVLRRLTLQEVEAHISEWTTFCREHESKTNETDWKALLRGITLLPTDVVAKRHLVSIATGWYRTVSTWPPAREPMQNDRSSVHLDEALVSLLSEITRDTVQLWEVVELLLGRSVFTTETVHRGAEQVLCSVGVKALQPFAARLAVAALHPYDDIHRMSAARVLKRLSPEDAPVVMQPLHEALRRQNGTLRLVAVRMVDTLGHQYIEALCPRILELVQDDDPVLDIARTAATMVRKITRATLSAHAEAVAAAVYRVRWTPPLRELLEAILQHELPVHDAVTTAVMSLFVNPKREIRDLVKYRDIQKLGMSATQRLAMFVKDIAHFQDPETRVDILFAVRGQMHGASSMQSSLQEYLPCIAACLKDAHGGVRNAAARVLLEVSEDAARLYRRQVAEALMLSEYTDMAYISVLCKTASDDNVEDLAPITEAALGHKVEGWPSGPDRRSFALYCLQRMHKKPTGSMASVKTQAYICRRVTPCLTADDAEVRYAALKLFSRMLEAASKPHMLHVASLLLDDRADTRHLAHTLLKRYPPPQLECVADWLLEHAMDGRHTWEKRCNVLSVLDMLPASAWTPARLGVITAALQSDDSTVQHAAFETLLRLDVRFLRIHVQQLSPLLQHSDAGIRASCLRVMSRRIPLISHPDPGHAVAAGLSSADLDERHSAVSVLTSMTIDDLERHATDIVDAIMRLEDDNLIAMAARCLQDREDADSAALL